MIEFDGQLVLTAAMLTTFTVELIKWVSRKYIMKDEEYDFPPIFYDLLVPFLTALWSILMGYIGWGDPVEFNPASIIQWGVTILLSFGLYVFSIKPVKSYAKEYQAKKNMQDGIF